MRADWDDAPHYVRHKKNELQRMGVVLVTGCAITASILFIGSRLMKGETPPPAKPEPQEQYVPRYDFSEESKPSGPTPEELFWADQQNKQQPKQTVFNDSNYIPKGAVNVVSTEGIRQSSAYRNNRERVSQARQRTVDHEWHWIRAWSGGASYKAKWTAIDNRIDGSTVCSNHKRGSIEYRECRKGAKQFFREQCRKDHSERLKERYCSAANSFSPMG